MANNTARKSDTVRHVEIVSRLYANDGSILFDVDNALEVIQSKISIIKNYCYIIHDRDIYEADTEGHKKGELKPQHIHMLLKFQDDQPQHIKNIAQWFEIPQNFISKIKGSWKAACLYQVHYNSPEKYQYNVSDVTSNFDFQAIIDEAHDKAEKHRKRSEVDSYIERILSGDIREYNKTLEIPQMLLVNNQRRIDTAFKIRSEFLQATQKNRQTECIYICGQSGCGKTTLAKKIADSKKMPYFISSGSNDIMDGYSQEPCLIVDDIRPSVLGLSDLLKMLDPLVASSVKSRYKNKYLNCDLVILTTVLDINTFYNNVFSEHDEPIIQLKRRCRTYIRMDKQAIYISLWDKKSMRYSTPVVYQNTILEEYIPKENITSEDVHSHISELIPFLEPDNEEIIETGSFRLQRATHAETEPFIQSPQNETISDEAFQSLINNKK